MFTLFKKNKVLDVVSPVTGKSIPLEKVQDEVFASKLMGEGVAFELEDDIICAPIAGEITLIAETKHAFGMTGENGLEILVHIGLDTVALNGAGFELLKAQGTKVAKGTPIIRVNRQMLQEKKVILTTPMVVTNSSEFVITIQEKQQAISGQTIMLTCEKK